MKTEFIHAEKFSEKTPHSYQGCCCSELWPLGISFCFTIKPWILGATESYVLQQMLTHATQYCTFSFSPLWKGWSCPPLSSQRPFFLFQESNPKYFKMKEGESGWKDKRQDRKQSQQAAAQPQTEGIHTEHKEVKWVSSCSCCDHSNSRLARACPHTAPSAPMGSEHLRNIHRLPNPLKCSSSVSRAGGAKAEAIWAVYRSMKLFRPI